MHHLPLTAATNQTLRNANPTAEAQRRALLDGRRILLVMGSYPGKRAVYQRARDFGLKLVVLDGPGHWAQAAAQQGLFEQFVEVDLRADETLFNRALSAVRATGLRFDGVATFEEFGVVLAAKLAAALGLPGHPPAAVAIARNKHLTRQVCRAAGIPTPRFAPISDTADLSAAAEHVGFPAVLKPIAGAASIGTYRVTDRASLCARFAQIEASLYGQLKTSAIHSDDERELAWATGLNMLLEEELDGEEFDVDCLLSQGRLRYAGVTRDWPQPHYKEVGAEMPPRHPAARQRRMVRLAARVLDVVGFADGVFHVEMKDTHAGPRLLEVNARMGGASRHLLNQLVWGVDLVEQYLMTVLGLPIRPAILDQPLVSVAQYLFPAPHSGRVAHARFLEPIRDDPRVAACNTLVSAGQPVVGPEAGPPDWLGDLIVSGPTPAVAVAALDELRGRVELPIVADLPQAEERPGVRRRRAALAHETAPAC